MLCDCCAYINECNKITSKTCSTFKYNNCALFSDALGGETYYALFIDRRHTPYSYRVARIFIQNKVGEKVYVSVFSLRGDNNPFVSYAQISKKDFEENIYKTKEDAEKIIREMGLDQQTACGEGRSY